MDTDKVPSCGGNKNRILPSLAGAPCGCSLQEYFHAKGPALNQRFVAGSVSTPAGPVPRVSSQLHRDDYIGSFKARWGVGRMNYAVDPGLYALGNPGSGSPVLASANYKMSFDRLRESLPGTDAWILVLDTKGINVWCAAGKGTFGTDELVERIESSGLKEIVGHRFLILPQLAGPGVAAHEVKKRTGFTVRYGPVRARDIKAYMDAGFKAGREMRRKDFPLRERIVLIPIELVAALKPAMFIVPVLLIVGGFGGGSGFVGNMLHDGIFAVTAFLLAILSGAVLTPVLLPYLPGRAFALKGLVTGLAVYAALLYAWGGDLRGLRDVLFGGAWFLLLPAFSAFLAMNFTGASTYTSLSGVKKEMRWALPLEIGAGVSGVALLIVSRVL